MTINLRKSIDADVISLAEIGWSESRTDAQIKKYIKGFVSNNYDAHITDDVASIIIWIIDDLISDMRKRGLYKDD